DGSAPVIERLHGAPTFAAKSKEQRAKSKGQRAKGRKQRDLSTPALRSLPFALIATSVLARIRPRPPQCSLYATAASPLSLACSRRPLDLRVCFESASQDSPGFL